MQRPPVPSSSDHDLPTMTWTSPGPTADPDAPKMCPPHCFEGRRLHLIVAFDDQGAHQAGVPFPHGSWCLQPSDWSSRGAGRNATAEVRSVDRGQVLWVASTGQGSVEWWVDVTNRSTCETFRYDPWSIEPNPADGTVDVQADSAARLQVYLDDEHGPCTLVTQYNGTTMSGWATLHESFNGTACA